jgi:hypothetical protein
VTNGGVRRQNDYTPPARTLSRGSDRVGGQEPRSPYRGSASTARWRPGAGSRLGDPARTDAPTRATRYPHAGARAFRSPRRPAGAAEGFGGNARCSANPAKRGARRLPRLHGACPERLLLRHWQGSHRDQISLSSSAVSGGDRYTFCSSGAGRGDLDARARRQRAPAPLARGRRVIPCGPPGPSLCSGGCRDRNRGR